MSTLSRFLALSLFLLLTLLVAAMGAQAWLRQQEAWVRASSQARVEQQIQAATALTGRLESEWTDQRVATLTELSGVPVRRVDDPKQVPASDTVLEVEPGVWLSVGSATAPGARLLLLSQRVLLGLGMLALALLIALIGALATRRARSDIEPDAPLAHQRRDVLSLAQLARTSVSQREELDRERDERLSAEAEARLHLQLLNRALEEKIRIGRDLHDGVIQSLYASGLTLQSAQALAARDPAEAGRRIENTVGLINRTIEEIRAYIVGLSPLSVRGNSIARALEDVVEELRAGRDVKVSFDVDETSAARLTDSQITDTLQIMREGVSNALRHGSPGRLQVDLHDRGETVVLRVEDDGAGFDPAAPRSGGGHGLANMVARAERGGGQLKLESQLNQGTRLELTWPTTSLA
jgi:signal transduction histidine kinase